MGERSASRAIWGFALALAILVPAFAGCTTVPAVVVRTSCTTTGDVPVPVSPTTPTPDGSTTPPSQGRPVQGATGFTLGVLLPPPGTAGLEDLRRGIDLAVFELRQAGADVTVDARQPGPAVGEAEQAVEELATQAKASIIVSALDTPTTQRVMPIAVRDRIGVISATSRESSLSANIPSEGYFFRVPPTEAVEGRALVELLLQSGCRTAQVVHEETEYGRAVSRAFTTAYAERGGSTQDVIGYELGSSLSVKTIVDRVILRKAEAIVVIGHGTEGARIVSALNDYQPPRRLQQEEQRLLATRVLFFSGGLNDEAFVATVGTGPDGRPLLNGLRGTAPAIPRTPATTHFEQAYSLRYGSTPLPVAAQAYDATYWATLAVQCAQTTHAADVVLKVREVVNGARSRGDTDVSGEDAPTALTVARNCLANYVGASGDFDLDRYGDPETGMFSFWMITGDGLIRTVRTNVEP